MFLKANLLQKYTNAKQSFLLGGGDTNTAKEGKYLRLRRASIEFANLGHFVFLCPFSLPLSSWVGIPAGGAFLQTDKKREEVSGN